jgi:hypothetical protein
MMDERNPGVGASWFAYTKQETFQKRGRSAAWFMCMVGVL